MDSFLLCSLSALLCLSLCSAAFCTHSVRCPSPLGTLLGEKEKAWERLSFGSFLFYRSNSCFLFILYSIFVFYFQCCYFVETLVSLSRSFPVELIRCGPAARVYFSVSESWREIRVYIAFSNVFSFCLGINSILFPVLENLDGCAAFCSIWSSGGSRASFWKGKFVKILNCWPSFFFCSSSAQKSGKFCFYTFSEGKFLSSPSDLPLT